jgi:diguanylate cyclase (GGDEF)-like protein
MNEAFGDKAAKEIVKNVADYFANNESKIEYVARVAEDKFAALLTGIKSHEDLYESVDQIISGSSTIDTSSNVFHVTMSAGIALYPEHGNDIESLMITRNIYTGCRRVETDL